MLNEPLLAFFKSYPCIEHLMDSFSIFSIETIHMIILIKIHDLMPVSVPHQCRFILSGKLYTVLIRCTVMCVLSARTGEFQCIFTKPYTKQ